MNRWMVRILKWFLTVAVVLPIFIGATLGLSQGWPKNWRTADWGSSGILPQATQVQTAQVLLLSTRTGRWKSIFAEHMSIVYKAEGARNWTRYDVVGWGSPVRKDAYVADAYWYGNTPRVIYRAEGEKATQLIPRIEDAISRYPHQQRGSYRIWPGPNSNTFVAWVVRNTEGFDAELSPVAVGKDWLGPIGFAEAPSKSGYSLIIAGIFGATVAREEGIELHLLGSTVGLDANDLALKLPALGKVGLL